MISAYIKGHGHHCFKRGGQAHVKVLQMEGLGSVADIMSLAKSSEGVGLSEIMALQNSGGGFGGGNQGLWWILILILLLGGGFGGLGGLGRGAAAGAAVGQMDFVTILDRINSLSTAQCQEFAALMQNMNSSTTSVTGAIQNMRDALASCCCETQRSIDRVNYDLSSKLCNMTNDLNMQFNAQTNLLNAVNNSLSQQATNYQFANITEFNSIKNQAAMDKCELLTAIKNSESNIINYMTAEKIHTLETENALLRADIGRREQTTAIVAAVQAQCGPACCPTASSSSSVK